MRHNNKIVFLVVIVLLTSEYLPHIFGNVKNLERGSQVSLTELCCCGIGADECQDCAGCCSKGSGETNDSNEETVPGVYSHTGNVIISSCDCYTNDGIFSPELTYITSVHSVAFPLPFASLSGTSDLQYNGPLSAPICEPPRL